MKWLQANLLHGEHTLHIHRPLAHAAKLITTARLVHIADKGKAAVAVMQLISKDATSGDTVCTNEFTNFIKGAGGFGGSVSNPDYRAAPSERVPSTSPDCEIDQQTSPEQAALYRLNGDKNPLHIDPAVSQQVGFEQPILHGLCTFGIAAKHVLEFAQSTGSSDLRSIKVRVCGSSFSKIHPHYMLYVARFALELLAKGPSRLGLSEEAFRVCLAIEFSQVPCSPWPQSPSGFLQGIRDDMTSFQPGELFRLVWITSQAYRAMTVREWPSKSWSLHHGSA